jgi:hypothetical protein
MRAAISGALRNVIRERALSRCEYCLASEVDAVLPRMNRTTSSRFQHGGETMAENLAFACLQCNHFKEPNIASVDPETRSCAFLFNPRKDRWTNHFRFDGVRIAGKTAKGRATVWLLKLNAPPRLEVRQALLRSGRFPPKNID